MLEKITHTFSDIFKKISGKASISEKNIEEAVEEIKMALLEADVNLRVIRRFVNSTIEEAKGETVLRSVNPGQQFIKIVHDKIVSLLSDTKQDLQLKGPDTESIILFLGLQGSGKTTSAAKLAARLKSEGRKPLLVACDLVRPAAVEQLSILAEKISVPVYKEDTKDALKVAKNAIGFAKKNGLNTIIVDTAGRMQVDEDMMAEIKSIKKALKPDETILVADAMT
ncbi:MAG TPA: signal recognition particle protein, partial [Treponema sp.]|nr:signal recognition particle protein [Treponema sp.]